MKRILSGIQPTGNLHLGNYLGAIRNWVAMQHEYECYYMLADLHAITVPQKADELKRHVRETAAAFIACGVDPEKCAIFPQSAVKEHSELAWVLACHTPLGWLNRMTQFKEKAQTSKMGAENLVKHTNKVLKSVRKLSHEIQSSLQDSKEMGVLGQALQEGLRKRNWQYFDEDLDLLEKLVAVTANDLENLSKANLGLYSYPVLMAADILVYKATHVPVGEDQKQHIELARDIAGAFNRYYNKECFPLPEPVIMEQAARIMSLRDGTKKMSKSEESDYSRINLTDDADTIALKFKKAKSDSIPTVDEDIDNRPEATNLLTIYAALKGVSYKDALAECAGLNFSAFKQQLTDVAVEKLSPITQKMRELLADTDYIDQLTAKGVYKARKLASSNMKEVNGLVGFLEF